MGSFCCCCSVTHLCLMLCHPMDCSMSSVPVLYYLPEFAKTHAFELMMPSKHLFLCHPLLLMPSVSPTSGSFLTSWLFLTGGQSIGASALILPMSIQGWFLLGLTGLISLLSKGLSRVFFSTTILKPQLFGIHPSLWLNSHICTWLLEKLWWIFKFHLNFLKC